MPDIHKRLEKAEKYLQKGKQEDALDEYLKALDEDPHNEYVRQTAADLCVTLGKSKEAAGLLSDLFDAQAAINDQAKAIANYKKLQRLGTPTIDQTFKYAQFIEKSDKKQALEGYKLSVDAFAAADRSKEALDAHKHLVTLDPAAKNYQAYAEYAESAGDKKVAAAAFLKWAELEPASASTALERGFKIDNTNAEVALAHAKNLIASGRPADAVNVLKPITNETSPAEFREQYVLALLAGDHATEAEPFVWALYQAKPQRMAEPSALVNALLRQGNAGKALAAAQRFEQIANKADLRREFISALREVVQKNPPAAEFLEYMVGLYNSANREQDYCETLVALFQVHYASGNFLRAIDCLDRIAEVDPYQPGNQQRLEQLRGKVDQQRFNSVANRLTTVGAGAVEETAQASEEKFEQEPTMLEDFMLQAEIFMQYSMRSKAVERLERIAKLFPHEEDQNDKLRSLYANAGFVPKYGAGAAAAAAAAPAPVAAPRNGVGTDSDKIKAAAGADENAVDNFARVTEITRNIYRQSTVKGVLFTAVNDVGRHYGASRCIAGLLSPGKPPSAALEYCAPGVKQSEVQHIVKLLGAVQNAAVVAGIVSVDDAAASPMLATIRDSITALGIQSLLAAPLIDPANEEHSGLLILEQCNAKRNWRSTDAVVLKTIADQMTLAVNNAKLRSLMKNLAVTDEKSGLLKRSSYFDVLLSEAKRATAQNATASVLLFSFGRASALVKEIGEPAVEAMMQQVGQTICAQVRQNDIAVRYDLASIALILPDTNDKNAFFVVDKMRKVLAGQKMTGTDKPLTIAVGIAEAVMQQQYEAIDIVTEVINRAEAALDAARAEGPNSAKALAPQLQAVAVA
jgi:diguanylate cyclase (GGDEF)-like protein